MKTLMLMRHAKAGWGDAALGDFDRPLNARGHRDARAMGREMAALGLGWDRLLASPAARAAQTVAGLAESYGAIDPADDRRLYLAPAELLLTLIRGTPDSVARLLLVGHNPGLERLALLLSRGGALHDEVARKYPSGALAEISLPAESWQDVAESSGTLVRFLRPRDLA